MLNERKQSVNQLYNRQLSSTSGNDSFVLAEDESRDRENPELSHRIKVSTLVDDILDGKVDIETCGECNNQIMDELQKRLTKIEDDTNAFKTAIEAFGQDEQDDTDEDALIVDLEKLRCEEKSLQKKLDTAEKEYFQTQKDIKFLKSEVSDLSLEEVKLEREYATLKAELANLEEEQKSHDLEHRSMDSHLRKLKNLSPLAAAFHISRKGKYGVINGLRLGFIEPDGETISDPVTWEELSAAWGQTALLTKIIIQKAGFTIDKYTICPLGSRSFILDQSGNRLPLYTTQNLRTKLIGDRAFDNGLTAYSEIMSQMKDNFDRRGTKLPYNISNGQIQETNGSNEYLTVKFNFSSGEQWCQAMRLLLTNLKWARDGITEK